MKKFIFAFITLGFLSSGIAAAPKKLAPENVQIFTRTVVGSRAASFLVQKKNSESTITMSVEGEPTVEHKLSEKNYQALLAEFKKLPKPKIVPKECYRSRIDISFISNGKEKASKASCFGISTHFSKKYVRYANMLTLAL